MGRAIARVTPWVLGLSLQLAAFAPGAVAVEYGRCHKKDTAPGGPPELQAAIVAYDRGDYSNAYQRFYSLATQGNAEAQYYVGCLHDGFHLGMRQDYAVALRWYRAAADQGHAEAQMRLGDLYAHGRGVPKDVREASRWYKAAESQRHAAASRPTWDPSQTRREQADMQIRLDEALAAYQRGDYPTAFAQFTDLANERGGQPRLKDAAHVQRLAQARYWLGLMYEKGQGTAQNLEEAARWYDAAYKSGNAEGAFNLAALYEQGRGVAPDYNKAHQLYSAAQARGHPQASAALQRLRFKHFQRADPSSPPGQHFRSAPGPLPSGFDAAVAAYVRGDWAWAAEEFLPLAQAGNVEARIYLGAIYGRDGSVPRHVASARKSKTSLNESIRWYRAAADQGSAAAQYWLGSIYASDLFDDNGRKLTDYAESVRWLRAAAEQGHPQAQMALGNAYRQGRGVATNRAETDRWYQTSHKQKEGAGRLIEPQCVAVAELPVFAAVYAACNRGDAAETSRQLLRLAKEGNAKARNWLAYLYYRGLPGSSVDAAPHPFQDGDLAQHAARWMKIAAEQKDPDAQYNLGVVYEYGMGVPANAKEAARWYQASGRPRAH